jgi:hypothetical protein
MTIARTRAPVVPPRSGRRRRPHALLGVLAAVLMLAACSRGPGVEGASNDGLRVELGDLLLADMMVLSSGTGQPGTVIGGVTNRGGASDVVALGLPDGRVATLTVAAGETLLLGPEKHAVRIDAVPAPPGAMMELVIDSRANGERTVVVPVLDGTFPRYSDLVPSPSQDPPGGR